MLQWVVQTYLHNLVHVWVLTRTEGILCDVLRNLTVVDGPLDQIRRLSLDWCLDGRYSCGVLIIRLLCYGHSLTQG